MIRSEIKDIYFRIKFVFKKKDNIMKKILLLLFAMTIVFPLFSQENNKEEPKEKTLFGGGSYKSGGYGAPEVKFTNVDNKFGVLVGGRGAWIINSTFAIGGSCYGLVTSHSIPDYFTRNDTVAYLRTGYGGLYLSYINSSDELVHFTINTLIGAGGATYSSSISDLFNDNKRQHTNIYETTAYFIFEPNLGMEINFFKVFRIELTAGYRFISGLELSKTKNSDLSGFSGGIAFKFGSF